MRILLIVGDDDFSVVLKHALRAMGDNTDIDCAATFCEAEDMLKQSLYSATVCDGDLKPTCRSTQHAAARIRELQPSTKIIFMASVDSDAKASKLADRVITKPFTSADIVKEISEAVCELKKNTDGDYHV